MAMMEKTIMDLVVFLVHVYTTKDMVVIFTKLYSAIKIEGKCHADDTSSRGGNRIAPPTKFVFIPLYLHTVFCKAKSTIVIII
jgi:hypothetical protein